MNNLIEYSPDDGALGSFIKSFVNLEFAVDNYLMCELMGMRGQKATLVVLEMRETMSFRNRFRLLRELIRHRADEVEIGVFDKIDKLLEGSKSQTGLYNFRNAVAHTPRYEGDARFKDQMLKLKRSAGSKNRPNNNPKFIELKTVTTQEIQNRAQETWEATVAVYGSLNTAHPGGIVD